MKRIIILLVLCLLLTSCAVVYAHPGGTDGSGGHYNQQNGGYHYHHGYSAHQHEDLDGDGNLDCPYNFVDKTDHSNKSSSSSNEFSESLKFDSSSSSNPKKYDLKEIFDFEIIVQLLFYGLFILFLFVKYICLPFYYYVIESIIEFFKKDNKENNNDTFEKIPAPVEEPSSNPQFYTGSEKIKEALKNISLENLSSSEKALIEDYLTNIRCMSKNIQKIEEINKERAMSKYPIYDQKEYELCLKKINIYTGIIIKLEERIEAIIK